MIFFDNVMTKVKFIDVLTDILFYHNVNIVEASYNIGARWEKFKPTQYSEK